MPTGGFYQPDVSPCTCLFGGREPEYCGAVERRGDGEDPVEVVVLLEHRHDLQRPHHHGHALLHVVRPHDGLLQIPRELGGEIYNKLQGAQSADRAGLS